MAERIRSPQDLSARREQAQAGVALRGDPKPNQITVHMGTCGIAAGAREVLTTLVTELDRADVDSVTLRQSGCAGLCDREPMLTLQDSSGQEYRYGQLNAERIRRILEEHVLGDSPVMEYLITAPSA